MATSIGELHASRCTSKIIKNSFLYNRKTHNALRARLGRGGRIMIDRIPRPPKCSDTPRAITYGSGTVSVGYHTSTLGADGPVFDKNGPLSNKAKNNVHDAPRAQPHESDLRPPSLGSHLALSRKIEAICARGIADDLNDQQQQQQNQKVAIPGNDTDEILIPLEDFLDAPPGFYGKEKYVIGPL